MNKANHIECLALADLHAAAPPALRNKLGLTWTEIDGIAVSAAPGLADTAIVINRVPDISGTTPLTPERIGAVLAFYASAGVDRYFVQSKGPSDPSLLHGAGLEPSRAWQTFSRQNLEECGLPANGTDLTVRKIAAVHRDEFGTIVSEGFDLGPNGAEWLSCLPGRSNWHVFMAFDGNVAVGAGALFVMNGTGWCDWAVTVPGARGRGCQSALIAARLTHARSLGCRNVFSCTGAPVPGDPQHSYHNLLRAGFRETNLRQSFVCKRPQANEMETTNVH